MRPALHQPTLLLALLGLAPFAATHAAEAAAESAAVERTEESAMLPLVRLRSRASPADELSEAQAGGQLASGARLGALGTRDVLELPFSVSAYTAALIEAQQARTLGALLNNDAALRVTTSSGHMYENFRVRGFDINAADIAIEGLFGLAPVGHVPLEFVERAELLKGPNAAFGGMPPDGGVGGLINLVPKRAGDADLTRVELSWQQRSQLGTGLDVARRFGADKAWGLRVNLSHLNGETQLQGQHKRRDFASAALDYRGEALKASLDAYHSREAFDGGTPAMFWFAGPRLPETPDPRVNQFANGAGALKSDALIGRAELRLSDAVDAFAALGQRRHDFSGFINGTHARMIDPQGNYSARMVAQLGHTESRSGELGLRGLLTLAGSEHRWVLQATRLSQDSASDVAMAPFKSNLYRPATPPMPALPTRAPHTGEATLQSLALLDTISSRDGFSSLNLALRRQQITTRSFDRSTGALSEHYQRSALSPSLGLVLRPWGPELALYANYVQGLSQGDTVSDSSASNYLQVFAPYKTVQRELGLKWQREGLLHSLAWFEIEKPSLIATGPASRPTYVDGGLKRVRGLEWSSTGELRPGWRLLAGATLARGRLPHTEGGAADGHHAVGAPAWQANLGLDVDVAALPGLSLDARLAATAPQYLDAANQLRLPAWQQLDVGARLQSRLMAHPAHWRLGISNLLNRRFFNGAFSDSTPIATLGPARSLSASLAVDF